MARVPRWVWVLGALVLAVAVLIAVWDWNWFKGPIERRVTAATGRSFVISGDLDVDLGSDTLVRADGIEFGNAPWADTPRMVELGRVEARIATLALLRGRVEIPYLSLEHLDVLIERNRDGVGNWAFVDADDEQPKRSGGLPLIGEVRVSNGKLRLHEPVLQTDLSLDVASGEASRQAGRAPLIARGEGTYRGDPFQLAARVDSPLDLANKERPYRVDLTASAGDTRAHLNGALHGQLQLENLDVHFDLAGPDLADLYRLVGIPLPQTPAYSLTGQLRRAGDVWSYRKFKGKVGNSDLAGDAALDLGGARPRLTADVVSMRLDLKDLAGVVGGNAGQSTGQRGKSEDEFKAVPVLGELQAPARTLAPQPRPEPLPGPRVLPDTPFRLDKLRIMDADVKLVAASIDAPKLPLEKMSVHLLLDEGVLELKPLTFAAAGGRIASNVTLDAREASIQTTATAEVHELDLGKLFPTVQIARSGAGRLSGAVAITAQGNSVARMLGSANGDIGLIMGPGHVSNLLLELAGLDVAESLKYLLNKDKQVALRCAFADFKVADGQMAARGLAFDTSDTVIYGQGTIDMRAEGIDLRLVPQPKDRSPVALRVPLKIGGTFKDPSFHPEAAPLILRSAVAAALYAVTPPAALLALIETGPGKNESLDCAKANGEQVSGDGS